MTVTTDTGKLTKCDHCPATIADKEIAFEEGWSICPESDEVRCECCHAEYMRGIEREFGWMRRAVRENRQLHKDGEHEAARAVAYCAGVIDGSEQ